MINFQEGLIIENNIFGYELKGIKILDYSSNITLIKNGNVIELGTIIDSGDNIQFKFNSNEFYSKGDYIIEYTYVLTEPDYEIYNQKAENLYTVYGNDKKNETEYFQKNEYIGKSSNYIIILTEN